MGRSRKAREKESEGCSEGSGRVFHWLRPCSHVLLAIGLPAMPSAWESMLTTTTDGCGNKVHQDLC